MAFKLRLFAKNDKFIWKVFDSFKRTDSTDYLDHFFIQNLYQIYFCSISTCYKLNTKLSRLHIKNPFKCLIFCKHSFSSSYSCAIGCVSWINKWIDDDDITFFNFQDKHDLLHRVKMFTRTALILRVQQRTRDNEEFISIVVQISGNSRMNWPWDENYATHDKWKSF